MLALRRVAASAASKRAVFSVQTASFSATLKDKERAAESAFFKYVLTF